METATSRARSQSIIPSGLEASANVRALRAIQIPAATPPTTPAAATTCMGSYPEEARVPVCLDIKQLPSQVPPVESGDATLAKPTIHKRNASPIGEEGKARSCAAKRKLEKT